MNDPYLNTQFCEDRFYSEYLKYKKLVIACDFDDTVFDFHNKGYQYPKLIELLEDCQKLGFYICIFTGSQPEKYDSILDYMKNLGIEIHSINKNPFPMPFGNHGKMYYNILLDDRGGLKESYGILRNVVDKIKQTL